VPVPYRNAPQGVLLKTDSNVGIDGKR
jgi:hypothetical protein